MMSIPHYWRGENYFLLLRDPAEHNPSPTCRNLCFRDNARTVGRLVFLVELAPRLGKHPTEKQLQDDLREYGQLLSRWLQVQLDATMVYDGSDCGDAVETPTDSSETTP